MNGSQSTSRTLSLKDVARETHDRLDALTAGAASLQTVEAYGPGSARIVRRARPHRGRWVLGVGLSVGLHAAPLLLMAGYWATRPTPVTQAPPVFEVELVRLQAPPLPPSEQPPGPEQIETKVRPVTPRPPIEPRLALNPPPNVEPLSVPPPRPPVDPAPPRPAAPETTAPPSPPAHPAVSAASSRSWEGEVLAHLERRKRYPQEARSQRLEGVAMVRFSMDRRGRVLSVDLARSSGHAVLDREAIGLLRRAQPLPAPPAEVAGDPLSLTVPVEFFQRRR